MSFFAAFVYRQFIHEPPVPNASFEGKTVIITGASSGLGLEACRWMVRLGASQVILACRNVDKAKAAAKDIQTTTLCSSDTLQLFSERVKAELPRVDVLIANAGLGTQKFRMTEDNEETITTNVVSMSLLAFLLHPKLRETAAKYDTQTHFTLTASELYEVAKFKELNAPAGQLFATLNDKSKANITSGVIVNCVAPGGLHREYDNRAVRIAIKILARSTEVGARTLVHGASVGPESHGQYVPDCKITPTAGLTEGKAGARVQTRVWLELKQKLEAIQPGVTSLS